jgi:hypothetical protein
MRTAFFGFAGRLGRSSADPDLEGTWTSDDQYGVPLECPAKFGTRKTLTAQELADRVKEDELLQSSIEAGERPNAGYWKNQKGGGCRGDAAFHSLKPGKRWRLRQRRGGPTTGVVARPDDVRSCISRGVAGSIFPVVYGNGTQFIQTKGNYAMHNRLSAARAEERAAQRTAELKSAEAK